MPDLDNELAELRAGLRESVHQPELDTVIERSRQRSARRRTQLGAVAAVLVVGAAIPVLRTAPRPVADDPATPQTTETSVSPAPMAAFLYDVDFADATHGFAIRMSCVDHQGKECRIELLVTEDGEHWQARSLPPEVRQTTASLGPRLFVFGPRSAALGWIMDTEQRRFATSDAGQTWTPVPPATSKTIAAIPDGGVLEPTCASPPPAECKTTMVVVEPGTGYELRLETLPPLVEPLPAANRPVAGGWWVGGKDPATGNWMLAVSRDAGRSWSTRTLPGSTTDAVEVAMTARGSTLYVAVGGNPMPDVNTGLLAIYRSVDGGTSWEQTFRAEDKGEPRSIAGWPVATADGRLLIPTETGGVWASKDGGRTFQVQPNAEFAGFVRRTRAGYLANTSVSGWSNVYKLSTDGVRWKEIRIG